MIKASANDGRITGKAEGENLKSGGVAIGVKY
jgi:hypothetical protein